MTTKQNQRVLRAFAVVAVLLAVAVFVWGMFVPVAIPEASRTEPTGIQPAGNTANKEQQDRLPTLDQLRAASLVQLRRPLREPPPPPPPPAQPLLASLVGTINEPGNSVAMIRLANGQVQMVGIDQAFEDPAGPVTVRSIREQSVTIEIDGEPRELVAKP